MMTDNSVEKKDQAFLSECSHKTPRPAKIIKSESPREDLKMLRTDLISPTNT